jgi:hypothetical protein
MLPTPEVDDACHLSRGAWSVVCTTARPNDLQMAAFLAHHLDMGAAEIFVYLDTSASIQDPLDPRITVKTTDSAYWHAKGGRPADHRARQIKNANDALQWTSSSFITHLDDDELIYSPRSLIGILSELPADLDGVELPPCEPCLPRVPRFQHELYTSPFRRLLPPGIPGEKRSVALFGEVGRVVARGLQGHRMGKFIIRTTQKRIQLGIHRANIEGRPARCRKYDDLVLLHLFASDPIVWLNKFLRRLQLPRFLCEEPHRMRQWTLLFRAQSVKDVVALYSCLNIFNWRRRWLLRWLKALLQPDLSIETKLAKYFPSRLPELQRKLDTFNATNALREIKEARLAIRNHFSSERGAASNISTLPNLPRKELTCLQDHLTRTRCFLEFGSAGGTVLAARTGVRRVYSVDTQALFLKHLSAYVLSMYPDCRLRTCLINIDIAKRCRHPLRQPKPAMRSDYFTKPWSRLSHDSEKPDLIFIAGRFRVACFLSTMLMARPGAIIIFADYTKHRHYRAVEKFISPTRTVGRFALFRTPRYIHAKSIAMALCQAGNDSR